MTSTAHAAIALLAIVALAAHQDMRRHRLPNILTGAGLLLGIGLNFAALGPSGLQFSFLGAVTGFAVFLPMYALRGMSAGDVKLMAAVGSFLGWEGALVAAATGLIAGGVLALTYVAWRVASESQFSPGLTAVRLVHWRDTLGDFRKQKFPYALAIALGSVGALWQQSKLGELLSLTAEISL